MGVRVGAGDKTQSLLNLVRRRDHKQEKASTSCAFKHNCTVALSEKDVTKPSGLNDDGGDNSSSSPSALSVNVIRFRHRREGAPRADPTGSGF